MSFLLSATLWVGGVIYSGLLLVPVLATVGDAARPVMAGLRARGMFTCMPAVAVVAILSAVHAMWIASGGFAASYFATGRGAMYGISGALAILTFALGMLGP